LLGDCSTPSKKQKKKTEGNKGQDKGKKAKKKQIEGTHCGDEAKVCQAFAYLIRSCKIARSQLMYVY